MDKTVTVDIEKGILDAKSKSMDNQLSFNIPQKQRANGKYEDMGYQTINISNTENIINVGRNLLKDGSPVCSIVNKENQLYLIVNKNVKELKDLEIFSDGENEKYNIYKITNATMYANEDISFELLNPNATSFGKISIKAKGIVHEKSGVVTNLLQLGNESLNIELPKNLIELTKDSSSPLQLRANKQSKRFALPAQMFSTLKQMENNGIQNIKVKEWTNIGKRGQTLRIALYGDKILVGDGVELKEVYAGFKIIPDTSKKGKTSNKDLIIRFDTSTEKIGESKNSKLLDGLSPNTLNEIAEFLPKEINGQKVIEEESQSNIEHLQIESIQYLLSPKTKIGLNSFVAEPTTMSFAPDNNTVNNNDNNNENVENVDNSVAITPEPVAEATAETTAETEANANTDETETNAEATAEATETNVENGETETTETETAAKVEAPATATETNANANTASTATNAEASTKTPKEKGKSSKDVPKWQIALSGFTSLLAIALCILTIFVPGMPLIMSIFLGLIGIITGIPTVKAAAPYIKKAIQSRQAKAKKSKDKSQDNSKEAEKTSEEKHSKEKENAEKVKEEKTSEETKKESKKVSKEEEKKQKEAEALQEQVNQDFQVLLTSTNKTIELMEDYNDVWGKGAKTPEKQELLENSKKCVEELKSFRNTVVSQTKTQESLDKVIVSKQAIQTKYGATIKAVKEILGKTNVQEL